MRNSVGRFLAKNSFLFEPFTVRAGSTFQFKADPQTLAAYLLQVGGAQSLQQT